jgi:hypothetical protein
LNSNAWLLREAMTQTIAVYLPSSTQLLAAPEPVRVPSISTRANITFDQGRVTSVSAVYSSKQLRAGNVYQIVSSVSQADPDTLRDAGQEYPDWIERRYLQLPGTVTPRTRALAQQITADHTNAFDKAQAIEQYLRENLHYDLAAPPPPEGQDFVDFVLFDLQRGYCDYYATSFVVLARSVGIPARLVMGYAQGEYDEEVKAYRVRVNNGHSWPELFFPQYGWLQFEPTVIIDPIDWPEPVVDPDAATSPPAGANQSLSNPFDDRPELGEEPSMPPGAALDLSGPESGGPSWLFFVLLALLAIAAAGAGATYWITERRGTSGLTLVERAYSRMWRFAAWLGVPGPPDQTPYERCTTLKTLVPAGEAPITRITEMYVAERFGRGNGNGDNSSAEVQWVLLRPQLWKTWLQKRFSRVQQQPRRRWQDFHTTHQAGSDSRSSIRLDAQ